MKYVYEMSIEGRMVKAMSKFIRVERNRMNPIDNGSFVTIAYYQTPDFEIVGLVR